MSSDTQPDVLPLWALESVPSLRIGQEAGDCRAFRAISDLVLLGDSLIVVASGDAREVCAFTSGGDLRWRLGGRGTAPGRFRWIEHLESRANVIFAYDDQIGRPTSISAAGQVLQIDTVGTPSGLRPSRVWDVGNGRRLAVRAGPPATPDRTGMVVAEASYVVLDPGRPPDTVATAPGDELFLLEAGPSGRAGFRVPTFGLNEASTVSADDHLYARTGRGREIGVYSLDGDLVRIVRWTYGDLALTDSIWEAGLVEAYGSRAHTPDQYDMPRPSSVPGFGKLFVDGRRRLWVGDYAQYLRAPKRWFVFSPSGAPSGVLQLPEGFRLLRADGDRVLGVFESGPGPAEIQARRIRRGGDR